MVEKLGFTEKEEVLEVMERVSVIIAIIINVIVSLTSLC